MHSKEEFSINHVYIQSFIYYEQELFVYTRDISNNIYLK